MMRDSMLLLNMNIQYVLYIVNKYVNVVWSGHVQYSKTYRLTCDHLINFEIVASTMQCNAMQCMDDDG